MTTATLATFERLAGLDDETLATVTAAFGRTPVVSELDEAETARLDGIITAVASGQAQAAEASARVQAEVAATPALADDVPPDMAPLRQRVADMDPVTRQALINRWLAQGLPSLVDPATGQPATLSKDQHNALEALIAEHEPTVHDSVRDELTARWYALPAGPRMAVAAYMQGQGIQNIVAPYAFTAGRAWLLASTIERIEAEAAAEVSAAVALGPVADPPGQVVTVPVADAADLAAQPPEKAKVGEILAWVDGDPGRAATALDREYLRAKPRKGVVAALEGLCGIAPGASSPTAGGGVDPVTNGTTDTSASPFADPAPAAEVASDGSEAAPPGLAVAAGDGEPAAPSPAPLDAPLEPTPDEATVTATLESTMFRSLPVEEWGPLGEAAYLRRLATELGVAADIIDRHGKAANDRFNAEVHGR